MSSRERDRELERVPRREPELVDRMQVPRIGDGDLEHVVLEGVRNRDRALERVHRDELRRVGGDADRREVDERQVMARREHARDAVRRRGALLDQRIRDRRAVGRAPADERERVGPDELGRAEQVEDELGRLVDAERGAELLPADPVRARRPGETKLRVAVGSIGYPSNGLSAASTRRLDGLPLEEREVPVEQALAEEERDDRRRARGTARAGPPSCAPPIRAARRGRRRARARRETRGRARPRPSPRASRPSSSASFTSPMPSPFGYASDGEEEESGRAERRRAATRGSGRSACARRGSPRRPGSTMRFGTIRCWTSIDGERDEHRAEADRERRVGGRPEDRDAGDGEQPRSPPRRADRAARSRAGAVPAAPAQQEVRENGDVVAPQDLVLAAAAGGRRPEQASAARARGRRPRSGSSRARAPERARTTAAAAFTATRRSRRRRRTPSAPRPWSCRPRRGRRS